MRGEGRGGFLLGRFYFSKWLTFPVLGHKKVLVDKRKDLKILKDPVIASSDQFDLVCFVFDGFPKRDFYYC